jgi:hypothetical protein
MQRLLIGKIRTMEARAEELRHCIDNNKKRLADAEVMALTAAE